MYVIMPSLVALLAEGVDRNRWCKARFTLTETVALLAEGVDRNFSASIPVSSAEGVDRNSPTVMAASTTAVVALLAEGVDRNQSPQQHPPQRKASPSSRRAWIEIFRASWIMSQFGVALLAEGVDRNISAAMTIDREIRSPSSRRAWIEIHCFGTLLHVGSCRPPHGGRG